MSAGAPFTSGVSGLKFAWTSTISGASGLAIATYNGDVIVAGDSKSRLVVVADENIFLDECSFSTDTNLQFFRNLWLASAPAAMPSASTMPASGCDVAARRDPPSLWSLLAISLLLAAARRRRAFPHQLLASASSVCARFCAARFSGAASGSASALAAAISSSNLR
jgi:MYXO-CTERM domain-containing protein